MAFPVLPIRAIHGKNPATGGLRDFRKNEASNREVGQGTQEEEILEPSVATFIFRTREVFGGKNGEVHSPVSKNGRDDQSEAFQSGEIEIEEGIESVEKRVIKHPDFGRPTRSASFLLRLITVSQRFKQIFLSCSVIMNGKGEHNVSRLSTEEAEVVMSAKKAKLSFGDKVKELGPVRPFGAYDRVSAKGDAPVTIDVIAIICCDKCNVLKCHSCKRLFNKVSNIK